MDLTVTLTSHHDTLELFGTRAAARRHEYVFVGKSIYSLAYHSSIGNWLQAPIHHYALIKLIRQIQGGVVDKHFGLAPATITYQTSN